MAPRRPGGSTLTRAEGGSAGGRRAARRRASCARLGSHRPASHPLLCAPVLRFSSLACAPMCKVLRCSSGEGGGAAAPGGASFLGPRLAPSWPTRALCCLPPVHCVPARVRGRLGALSGPGRASLPSPAARVGQRRECSRVPGDSQAQCGRWHAAAAAQRSGAPGCQGAGVMPPCVLCCMQVQRPCPAPCQPPHRLTGRCPPAGARAAACWPTAGGPAAAAAAASRAAAWTAATTAPPPPTMSF